MLNVYALTLFLHIILPATSTTGYCCDQSFIPLQYRLNGALVFTVFTVLFLQSPLTWQLSFYENYWANLGYVNCLGIFVSTWFFIRGGSEAYTRCITVDQMTDEARKSLKPETVQLSPLAKFYIGNVFNTSCLH